MTKIAIYGAGAIGGYMGAKLAQAGADVSLMARGPHLAAMRQNGLSLTEDGQTTVSAVNASDNPADLGSQDFVIVTLKAHSIPGVVEPMQALLGPDTAIVFAVNGVPWWYFSGIDGPFADTRLECVDPGGMIWDGLGPERAIGCVVYVASEISEPGKVSHSYGNRLSLGEPSGERSERANTLSTILTSAGLRAPVRPKIRDEMWIKLWGNCSFNPVSALTGGTLAGIANDPDTRAVIVKIMEETQAVGEALGVRFPITIEKRIAGAEAVGEHRTSMLQDLDKGRPMEIDALVGAVQELARLACVETPTLDIVLGLVKQRARLAGCYPT